MGKYKLPIIDNLHIDQNWTFDFDIVFYKSPNALKVFNVTLLSDDIYVHFSLCHEVSEN